MTKSYVIIDSERVSVITNWLGCEGIHFVQMLTNEEQETCKCSAGLFNIYNVKFIPQHNETILSIQYCKLSRVENETAEEWMTH